MARLGHQSLPPTNLGRVDEEMYTNREVTHTHFHPPITMHLLHPGSNLKTSGPSIRLLHHPMPVPCLQPDYTNSPVSQSGGSFSPVKLIHFH
ncbi:hypothetical protein TNCV_1674701 [Trichonephila clavipes]|nr:hypothetical protein TNCV_1674701 [Trichonephila clavipes]